MVRRDGVDARRVLTGIRCFLFPFMEFRFSALSLKRESVRPSRIRFSWGNCFGSANTVVDLEKLWSISGKWWSISRKLWPIGGKLRSIWKNCRQFWENCRRFGKTVVDLRKTVADLGEVVGASGRNDGKTRRNFLKIYGKNYSGF